MAAEKKILELIPTSLHDQLFEEVKEVLKERGELKQDKKFNMATAVQHRLDSKNGNSTSPGAIIGKKL